VVGHRVQLNLAAPLANMIFEHPAGGVEGVANSGFDKLAVGDEVRFVAQHSESAVGPQASTVVPVGKHHLPPIEAVRA